MQKRIFVLAIRAIGDVVLITPVPRLLKQKFPTAYLAALADGPSAQVLQNNPYIDRLFTIDNSSSRQLPWMQQFNEWVTLISEIRRERFDIVIDLFSGPRSAIISYLSGATDRYGEDFRNRGRGFLYNHPVKICRDGRHLIEQKLDLVKALLGKNSLHAGGLELFLTEKEIQRGQSLLAKKSNSQRRRIGLVPSAGSGWRIWPSGRFVELADALIGTYEAEIILLGGVEDTSVCRHIGKFMRAELLDLSGKTTLRELIAVMGELDLIISNVTGPMHLASALSKPKVIGLYGVADTIQYAPWGVNAMMVTKGSTQDAYWHKVDYQKDYEYLCRITVADVMEAAMSVMSNWATTY